MLCLGVHFINTYLRAESSWYDYMIIILRFIHGCSPVRCQSQGLPSSGTIWSILLSLSTVCEELLRITPYILHSNDHSPSEFDGGFIATRATNYETFIASE